MSNLSRKVVAVGLSLTTAVWLAGSIIPASAQTTADTIAQLMAQIQALQAQLIALQGSTATPSTSSYSFTKDLTLGSKGADVTALQQVLINGGYLTAVTAPTGYFGALTQTALGEWQAAHNVSPTAGYFGAKTRAALALAGGAGTGTGTGTGPVVVVPSGTDLVVSLASDTPTAKTLGSGTAFNPALKVNLTAGSKVVNVTGVTLQKTGFLSNTSLNGVDIVDALGVRHGNVVTSINADNTVSITFPSTPITVAAGQSTSFLVRFNLLTGSYTGTVGFSINSASAVLADTTSVSGTFPIMGTAMNIVNGGSALASTTLDALTSTGSSSLSVDPNSEQEITRFRIAETSSNEGVYLNNLTLYNYGNAGATGYKDVQLLDQVSNVLATAQPNGQYVTFNLATPYLIDKGLTKDFIVKAKLIGGTTQTINLVVYNNYDINLVGATTGVSVIPSANPSGNDTSFPIGNGFNVQTIGSGTATLTRATDSPSAAVTPGAQNIVLAKYSFKPTGENMEIRQVKFYIATSTGATAATILTGTVYVNVNGAIVYSTAASNISLTTQSTVNLSSYPIATSGQDNWITISTSIPSTAVSTDSYQVKSFDVSQVKRIVTGDLVDPGTAATDGVSLAVKAASMTVTTLSVPSANSVVVGTTGYILAEVQMNSQAGGEDVNVTQLTIKDTSSDSNYSGVTNLAMYSGDPNAGGTLLSTTASTATNAATVNFNFSTPLSVPRTTPVTLYLTGYIASSTSGSVSHTFKATSTVAVGASTGNSLTDGTNITYAGAGQAQTIVTTGSLTASLVSGSGASPSVNQTATIGTSNTAWFAFKLTSQYEAQKLTSLKLTATSTGTTGLSISTLRNISLYYDTATQYFATKSQFDSCSGSSCTVTFPSAGNTSDNLLPINIPTTGTTIYVKADIGGAGTADLGNSFKFYVAAATDITAKGAASAATSSVTGTPASSGYTFVVPQNVVVSAVSPTTATNVGTSAGQIVGVFQITNNGTAPILLSTSTLSFTNGGSATTTVSSNGSSTFRIYASAVGGGQADTSGWGGGSSNGNGYTALAGTTGASSTLSFATTTISAAEQQIDGGSWRYFTIKTTVAAANNDTFQLSVSALGNIFYNVAESALGYTGNPSVNSNLSDTNLGLYVNGTPSLSTVTAKN